MINFTVIQGDKNKSLDLRRFKHERYKIDYYLHLAKLPLVKSEDVTLISQIVFYGVNYFSNWLVYNKDADVCELQNAFTDICMLENVMSLLTYNEFINIFPIIKEYDGDRFESKDYFYVQDILKDKNLDFYIDDVDMFLQEYYNGLIIQYNVTKFMMVDAIRKAEGKLSIWESFLEEFDLEDKVDYYTHIDDSHFMSHQTGKIVKVVKPKKRKPPYLNLVK